MAGKQLDRRSYKTEIILLSGRENDGGSLIEHGGVPIVPSPSGLPTQHLINERNGSTGLFVGTAMAATGRESLSAYAPMRRSADLFERNR